MIPENLSGSRIVRGHKAFFGLRSLGGTYGFLWQLALMGGIAIVLAVLGNAIRSDSLPWNGDYSEQARLRSPSGRLMAISPSEAFRLYRQKNAVFIDARSAAEYREGHIRGALNVPLSRAQDLLLPALEGISDSTVVITYCDGPNCSLSKELADMIEALGFPDVRVLVNGWSVWKRAGYPVERPA